MFERIAASYELACSSWQVLRKDKQLVVFPVVSGIGCLLVLISFALPMAVLPQWDRFIDAKGDLHLPWWVYVVAFAYYFCNYFVIVFCNAALISCALVRFNGDEPTLGDGFRAAASRLPQILAWALVSATVGLALKAVENANDKAGRLISGLLGTAWTVLTYFVVPVLVVEKVGPFQAIGRSIQILRKTWGEALAGHLGLGLLLFVLLLPGLALLLLGGVVLVKVGLVGLALILLGGVYFLLWMAVGSALNGIYLSALYQYAAYNQVPHGFDADTLQNVFQTKKGRWL